jgi:hypothetical protein
VSTYRTYCIKSAIPLYSCIDLKQIERNSGKTGAIGKGKSDKGEEGWGKGKRRNMVNSSA